MPDAIQYKGFTITRDRERFLFVQPDKESGNGDWSGWSFYLDDAREQIDDLIDEAEGAAWLAANVAPTEGE